MSLLRPMFGQALALASVLVLSSGAHAEALGPSDEKAQAAAAMMVTLFFPPWFGSDPPAPPGNNGNGAAGAAGDPESTGQTGSNSSPNIQSDSAILDNTQQNGGESNTSGPPLSHHPEPASMITAL